MARVLACRTGRRPAVQTITSNVFWCLAGALRWSVMLLKRRVSLPSASDVTLRVRHEVTTHITHATSQRASVLGFPILPLSNMMHTTPHRPSSAISPPSNTKWKRGRPVPAWSGFARPIYQGPGSCDKTSVVQPVQAVQDQDAEASAIAGIQRLQLWDSSKPIRFAPTACVEVGSVAGTSTASQVDNQPDLNGQGLSHSFADSHSTPSKRKHHSASDRQGGEVCQDTDRDPSSDNESTMTEDTAMEHPTDSDYVADQESEDLSDLESENLSDRESETDTAEQGSVTDAEAEEVVEEHVPLSYQIPEEVLRAAMEASPNTRASFWSTKFYRGPEEETILIHYCKSMDVADRVAQYFLKEKVVGFDIEWKPQGSPGSIKQNASLIQLACENRIALFHIAIFPGMKAQQLMPPNLKTILESPDIIKVGVSVKSDFTRLERYLGIQPRGVFELSRLHNLVTWYEIDPSKISKKLVGLALQVEEHLQLPLYKGTLLEDEPDNTSSVRESDWSLALDLDQIHYAAADAYAGFRLYDVLEQKRKKLRPTPSAIELCDHDPKAAPRSKVPRKKTKPKTTLDAETEPSSATEEQDDEEMEESDDAEGYDTAPEELIDSHQLEAPRNYPETESQKEDGQETVRSHKRIGKVNLSGLRGLDLEYPVLPHISSENPSVSSSQVDHAFDPPTDSSFEEQLRTELFEPDVGSESDEFADPELEEALKSLEFDAEGKLIAGVKEAALDIESNRQVSSNQASPPAKETPGIKRADHVLANRPSTATFKPLVQTSTAAYTPEYVVATNWAQTYLQSTVPSPKSTAPSRIRATVPHLRAYHMSIHQKLSLDDIAKHLRDPPLSRNTVAGYILQAISLERLNYDKGQLKDVMMAMSSNLRQGRWKWLAEQVGALH